MFGKKPKYERIRYEVEDVKAARAIFQANGHEVPRIDLTFLTEDGKQIDFDLDHQQLARLIEQTMAVYNTIFPPLKTSRGGRGL